MSAAFRRQLHVLVQARLGSRRLPGKVLLPVDGRPILDHVVERAAEADVGPVVVVHPVGDQAIAERCASLGVQARAGDEWDVLKRFVEAVDGAFISHVVRLTADCPLIDPAVVRLVATAPAGDDYCTTSGYPRGLGDVERMSLRALLTAHELADAAYDREHVTPYIRRNETGQFDVSTLEAPTGVHRPDARLCVDEPDDLRAVRSVYRATKGTDRSTADVIDALDRYPEIARMNAHVVQRSF